MAGELTVRQEQVLRSLLAHRGSRKETAHELHISVETVREHLRLAYRRLDIPPDVRYAAMVEAWIKTGMVAIRVRSKR